MEDKRISCSVCAWRATCKKRFMSGDSLALHCPEFTYDVSLKKKEEKEKRANGNGNR
jgi:hypothetical protein